MLDADQNYVQLSDRYDIQNKSVVKYNPQVPTDWIKSIRGKYIKYREIVWEK